MQMSISLICAFALIISVYSTNDPSCKYSVVGAGYGGAYYAYRLTSQGVVPAKDFCIFEYSTTRVGGRVYSIKHGGIWDDLSVDAAAYRFMVSQELAKNIAHGILNISTVCWNGDCSYQVYPDQYGNNGGYVTGVKGLLQKLYNAGMPPVFMGHELVNVISSGNPSKPIRLEFANGETVDTTQVLLNIPQPSVARLNAANLIKTQAPLANQVAINSLFEAAAAKQYLWYEDAWWLTKLGLTGGDAGYANPTSTDGQDPPEFWIRYLDGPVKCRKPGNPSQWSSTPVPYGTCKGALGAVYTFVNPAAYAIKWLDPSVADAATFINAGDANSALLTTTHQKLMAFFAPNFTAKGINPSSIAPPNSTMISHWNSTHRWNTPSFSYLFNFTDFTINPDTDFATRNLIQCPVPGFDVFLANEAWSNLDGWAEGSLLLVERLLAWKWGLGKPSGVSDTYYNTVVVPNIPTGPCGEPRAYQWAYPLWHSASLRYLSAKNTNNFKMNKLYNRRGYSDDDPVRCTASICSGVAQSTVNPSPVVAPDVDTLQATAWLDLRQAWKLHVPDPNGRYYSVQVLDMFTNTVVTISSTTHSNGGNFCLRPVGNTQSCGSGITTTFSNLPQYGQLIVKAYSSGASTYCGDDGCSWIKDVEFEKIGSNQPALDPEDVYEDYMSGGDGCKYVYDKPICGNNPNNAQFNNFWNAVCQALTESPLASGSNEANYVAANFGALGINRDGCGTLNYAALNPDLSARNPVSGFNQVANGITTSAWTKGPWVYQSYNGNWGSNFYNRVQASTRLHGLNTNPQVVYYTAFTDSAGVELDGDGSSYKITFANGNVPIDTSHDGFWSITAYDDTFYLINDSDKKYSVRSTSNSKPNEIHLAPNCANDSTRCITIPEDKFNVILRGYAAQAGFAYEGSYQLPTITKCANQNACK